MKNFIRLSVLALATFAAASADAQQPGTRASGQSTNGQLQQLLRDGYDIKAAFAEAGVPYVILQKGASAFLCRGGGAQTCEQLN